MSWLVFSWMLCQIAATSVLSAILYVDGAAVTCTCGRDTGAACPMHPHGTHETNSTPSQRCRSTADPASAVIVVLQTPVAILPQGLSEVVPVSGTRVSPLDVRRSLSQVVAPDAPPPRA
jgi:hypothetical protein